MDNFKIISDPHICTLCALRGKTCCTLVPGNEELCFPLSEAEQALIAGWAGDSAGLFEDMPNSPAFRDSLDYLFPEDRPRLRELFPKGGRHLRLNTTPDGDCRLLGPQGCRLPRDKRPWYCRIFPFWVRWGQVMVIPSGTCLGVRKAPTKEATLELYAMTDAEVLEIFASLRRTWGLGETSWFSQIGKKGEKT